MQSSISLLCALVHENGLYLGTEFILDRNCSLSVIIISRLTLNLRQVSTGNGGNDISTFRINLPDPIFASPHFFGNVVAPLRFGSEEEEYEVTLRSEVDDEAQVVPSQKSRIGDRVDV